MMYGYYPERLPATEDAAKQRRGVRLEIGGMMRYVVMSPCPLPLSPDSPAAPSVISVLFAI